MTVLACLAAGLALWLAIPASPVIDSARAHREWAGLATVVLALATVPHDWVAPGLVLGLGVVGALLLWRRRVQTRTAQANAARLAEVCDLLAAELAAGRPTELALDEAARAWPALRPVAEVCRLGGDVPAAFVDVPGTYERNFVGTARRIRLPQFSEISFDIARGTEEWQENSGPM